MRLGLDVYPHQSQEPVPDATDYPQEFGAQKFAEGVAKRPVLSDFD